MKRKEIITGTLYLINAAGGTEKCHKILDYTFDSIWEFVNYIKTTDENKYSVKHSVTGSEYFTGTKSFEEALELLQNGWDEGAQMIDKSLKEKLQNNSTAISTRQRSVYDIVGGNASVPRYLQGVPTNMIRQVRTPVKQPITDVYLPFSYPHFVSKEQIIDNCVKILQKVVSIENGGTRVNLWAVRVNSSDDGTAVKLNICLKKSTERLNILKLAFPAIHPSMLRRMGFAFDEHNPDMDKNWFSGYGRSLKWEENVDKINKAMEQSW